MNANVPVLRILKPVEQDTPPATGATVIAVHYDHRDGGEYGVTINGEDFCDLVAYAEADEIGGNDASLVKLAANLAVCANQGTLTEANLTAAAVACGFAFTRI